MKRILILGASGTFGKALVEKLSNDEECHLTLASRSCLGLLPRK